MDLPDTLASTTANLCRAIQDDTLERVVSSTWDRERANFTKDNYLAWSLPWFAEQFRVIVLLRRLEDTFPPTRHRVMRWYEHFAWSAVLNGVMPEDLRHECRTPMDLAAVGFALCQEKMRQQAVALDLQVLWWHKLNEAQPSDLINEAFIDIIREQYRPRERPNTQIAADWSDAIRLGKTIID